MRLAETTWCDAGDTETDLAVVPVGSTEQHGPHAPLGTDTMAARAVAEAGIERYDGEAVLTPAVPVGVSVEHAQFPGTLSVGADTFRSYVSDVVESLASHGWDRVVVVNGHGGNVDALREVCGSLTRAETAYTVPFTWFDAIDLDQFTDLDGESMGHAGAVETSLVLHVCAKCVEKGQVEAARDGGASTWGEYRHGVNLAYDSAEFTENGVVGDPTVGSAELGTQLLAVAGKQLADLFETVRERSVERPNRR
jgi:creatinine amidohydrolase